MPAYYTNTIENFINEDSNSIVGILASQYSSDGFVNLINRQIKAWENQIDILKESFESLEFYELVKSKWTIIFEYTIPMIGQRIDTIILTNNKIIVIEFKVGAFDFSSQDKWQLYNYVMDLKDFHFESRNKLILPILLSSESNQEPVTNKFEDIELILTGKRGLKNILSNCKNDLEQLEFDHQNWIKSNFLPTPDIIKSAQLLFAGQDVSDILNTIAEADILDNTTKNVINIFNDSKANRKKSICFITGVPGSGKTLVGLNLIHSKTISAEGAFNGSFITGNVPLVLLLREALARDSVKRNPVQRISTVRHIVSTYLHKVHLFIKTHKDDIPNDNLIIFDEAQRAWDENMSKKHDLESSEPHTILNIMSRKEWCLIVALVGEGQEIYQGEAGIQEWLNVLSLNFHDWNVYMSNELKEVVNTNNINNLNIDNNLNLTVSVRSIRSNYLSNWVENTLNLNYEKAKEIKETFLKRYPLLITRNIEKAKNYIKYEKNDLERNGRYGVISSSGGRRLRPFGITVQESHKIEEWFLNCTSDVRSSNFMELVMTEFSIQGLELDWTCLCWDADLRIKESKWGFFEFKGTKWNKISNTEKGETRRKYLLNKYRVLLTRAREGIVVFIPEGSDEDSTRNKGFYDETYNYLLSCGMKEI